MEGTRKRRPARVRRVVAATAVALLGTTGVLLGAGPVPLGTGVAAARAVLEPAAPVAVGPWEPASRPSAAPARRTPERRAQRDRPGPTEQAAPAAAPDAAAAASPGTLAAPAPTAPVGRRVSVPAAATAPAAATPVAPAVPAPVAPPAPVRPPAAAAGAALAFTVASFNVLGSNHTAGAAMPGFAEGLTRAQWAADLIMQRRFDVVGLQEIQVDQLQVLLSSTNGALATYPPAGSRGVAVPQMIAWRTDTWDVVAATTFTIPFMDQQRPQPMVLLQHKTTGRQVWVVNVHLAPKRPRRDAEHERDAGTALILEHVRQLAPSGVPVLVVGDMNEHGEIYCDLARGAGLTSPIGGSMAGGCRPPRSRVDWIFGTPDVKWDGFAYHDDAAVRRITDHAVPVARAVLPAG